jgi:hypothetical protein
MDDNDMSDNAGAFEPGDESILAFDVSDAALEAAAATAIRGGAMTFPNAPTVSILFACCGNDDPAERRDA